MLPNTTELWTRWEAALADEVGAKCGTYAERKALAKGTLDIGRLLDGRIASLQRGLWITYGLCGLVPLLQIAVGVLGSRSGGGSPAALIVVMLINTLTLQRNLTRLESLQTLHRVVRKMLASESESTDST